VWEQASWPGTTYRACFSDHVVSCDAPGSPWRERSWSRPAHRPPIPPIGPTADVPAEPTAAERLAAELEAWRQDLVQRREGAWQRADEIARRIAADPDVSDDQLEAEADRILEAVDDLAAEESSDETYDQAEVYGDLWQTLQDALELPLSRSRARAKPRPDGATRCAPMRRRWVTESTLGGNLGII
jgi:hypothetical protein